jgi:hypothetical protein
MSRVHHCQIRRSELERFVSDATFREEVKALLLEVVELGEKRFDVLKAKHSDH